VVVVADTRGSGVSSGHRETEFSPELISDLGELVNWVVSQSWSNGHVGTFGNSYEGATAELTAVPNPPGLKAVVPIPSQFNAGMLILPGGIYNEKFVQSWSSIIKEDDQSDVCVTKVLSGLSCWWAGRWVRG
jgi:putative CocE/NonD family hydrolase